MLRNYKNYSWIGPSYRRCDDDSRVYYKGFEYNDQSNKLVVRVGDSVNIRNNGKSVWIGKCQEFFVILETGERMMSLIWYMRKSELPDGIIKPKLIAANEYFLTDNHDVQDIRTIMGIVVVRSTVLPPRMKSPNLKHIVCRYVMENGILKPFTVPLLETQPNLSNKMHELLIDGENTQGIVEVPQLELRNNSSEVIDLTVDHFDSSIWNPNKIQKENLDFYLKASYSFLAPSICLYDIVKIRRPDNTFPPHLYGCVISILVQPPRNDYDTIISTNLQNRFKVDDDSVSLSGSIAERGAGKSAHLSQSLHRNSTGPSFPSGLTANTASSEDTGPSLRNSTEQRTAIPSTPISSTGVMAREGPEVGIGLEPNSAPTPSWPASPPAHKYVVFDGLQVWTCLTSPPCHLSPVRIQ